MCATNKYLWRSLEQSHCPWFKVHSSTQIIESTENRTELTCLNHLFITSHYNNTCHLDTNTKTSYSTGFTKWRFSYKPTDAFTWVDQWVRRTKNTWIDKLHLWKLEVMFSSARDCNRSFGRLRNSRLDWATGDRSRYDIETRMWILHLKGKSIV